MKKTQQARPPDPAAAGKAGHPNHSAAHPNRAAGSHVAAAGFDHQVMAIRAAHIAPPKTAESQSAGLR